MTKSGLSLEIRMGQVNVFGRRKYASAEEIIFGPRIDLTSDC